MVETDSAPQLTLGSASPRRADLLATLPVSFVVDTIDIDERALVGRADVTESVTRIAQAKFHAFADLATVAPRPLLTADTLVSCNGHIMGKPDTDEDLGAMLRQMSRQTLQIATAICVGIPGTEPGCTAVTTEVHLRQISAEDVEKYVATGAGRDKAAGLALQAEASDFIVAVNGCWSNVLGLPVCAVAAALDLAPGDTSQAERCLLARCGVESG